MTTAATKETTPQERAGSVTVDSLRVSFTRNEVLHGISVEFPARSVTGLIGPTGCGKTTLLRSLNRLHDSIPGARVTGRILIDGQDVYRDLRDVRAYRRRVGMLFQRPNPFPQSIIDNVTLGPRIHGLVKGRRASQELAERTLQRVGLWDAVKDRLRASPFSLSGGQQQLLCLARALAVSPEVLLLDEPTSSLDPGSTRQVEALVKELAEQISIIIVTHNLDQAKRVANDVLFLLAGERVEFAPADVIFDRPADQRTSAYVGGGA